MSIYSEALENVVHGELNLEDCIAASLPPSDELRCLTESLSETLPKSINESVIHDANIQFRQRSPEEYLLFVLCWHHHCIRALQSKQLRHIAPIFNDVLNHAQIRHVTKHILHLYFHGYAQDAEELQTKGQKHLEALVHESIPGSHIHFISVARLLSRHLYDENFLTLNETINNVGRLKLLKSTKSLVDVHNYASSMRLHENILNTDLRKLSHRLKHAVQIRNLLGYHQSFRLAHDPKSNVGFVQKRWLIDRVHHLVQSTLKTQHSGTSVPSSINFMKSHPLELSYIAAGLLNRKRPQTAERVLDRMEKVCRESLPLNWYKCRLALQRRQPKVALRHFRRFRDLIIDLDAHWRFREEVRMSAEITPVQMADLLNGFAPRSFLLDDSKSQEIETNTDPDTTHPQPPTILEKTWYQHARKLAFRKNDRCNIIAVSGPTGCGKTELVRQLHKYGPLSQSPLIEVDCASLSSALMDSSLFGHSRGAFSGAVREHRGFVDQASGGILFLRGIHHLSPGSQGKIRNLIEQQTYRPLGSTRDKTMTSLVVLSLEEDHNQQASTETLRQDLHHAISHFTISVPGLEDRTEDIEELSQLFLNQARPQDGHARLSSDLVDELKTRSWPGNIRQLRNLIQAMVIDNCDTDIYTLKDLKRDGRQSNKPTNRPPREERLAMARRLFRRHKKLTRIKLSELLGVSTVTMTEDLKSLLNEGSIKKVMPNKSPRSHYFIAVETHELKD